MHVLFTVKIRFLTQATLDDHGVRSDSVSPEPETTIIGDNFEVEDDAGDGGEGCPAVRDNRLGWRIDAFGGSKGGDDPSEQKTATNRA